MSDSLSAFYQMLDSMSRHERGPPFIFPGVGGTSTLLTQHIDGFGSGDKTHCPSHKHSTSQSIITAFSFGC
jgi:hypothetical protein